MKANVTDIPEWSKRSDMIHKFIFILAVSCKEPDLISNAVKQGTGNKYGDRVVYECSPAYEHTSGNLNRTCQCDGTWSGETPVCKRPGMSV